MERYEVWVDDFDEKSGDVVAKVLGRFGEYRFAKLFSDVYNFYHCEENQSIVVIFKRIK